MNLTEEYTFDDILIKPHFSDIVSATKEISISTRIGKLTLDVPLISAAMTTVTGIKMQSAMEIAGGLGIHHRYSNTLMTIEERVKEYANRTLNGPIAVSPSMGREFMSALILFLDDIGVDPVFSVDVAHGDRQEVYDFTKYLKSFFVTVWSGNIATVSAAKRYYSILDPATDALTVGIGGGAACTTREVGGCGRPQATAVSDIYEWSLGRMRPISIISDGGIKTSGDIVKALALGADAVIIGRLFAGTDEAEAPLQIGLDGYKFKAYEGMASKNALTFNGKKDPRVEGVSSTVPYTGSVYDVTTKLSNGIITGLSYVGARNISELRKNSKFIKQTQNGVQEGRPRI